jgi:hypothetical protein
MISTSQRQDMMLEGLGRKPRKKSKPVPKGVEAEGLDEEPFCLIDAHRSSPIGSI